MIVKKIRENMPAENSICGIYVRLSVRDERALDYQTTVLKKFANEKGWKVHSTYKDLGQKGHGGLALRPELLRMVNDVREEKFNVVLAMSPDRIAQNHSEEAYIRTILKGIDVTLVYHEDAV
jgi:DNA invertase Pin-like site-specific DNA recombinase